MTEIERKGLHLIELVWDSFVAASDVDGFEIQDWLIKAGIAVAEPFDEAKHGSSAVLEPGDPFYVMDAEVRQALERPR